MPPPTSILSQAKVLVGVKIRQYYPGYGEGEENAQMAMHGWGVFGGEVVDVFEEEKALVGESAKRVVLRLFYEDEDQDDVCFKQVTAVTRGKSDGKGGFTPAPVICEDSKQDKEVVNAVRAMAKTLEWQINKEAGDLVREFALKCDIMEEDLVIPRKQVPKPKKRSSREDQDGDSEDESTSRKSKRAKGAAEEIFLVYFDGEGKEIYRRSMLKKDGTMSKLRPAGAKQLPDGNVGVFGWRLGRNGKPEVDSKANISTPSNAKTEDETVRAMNGGAARVTATGDGDEVVTVGSDVSLSCPISRMRIVRPCKGQDCQHMHCFDWDTFLHFVKKFTVTRVNMLIQTVSQFSQIPEDRIKVAKVDEEARFTTRDKTKRNATQVFLDIDLEGEEADQIVERVMSSAEDFISTLKRMVVKDQDPPSFSFVPEKSGSSLVFMRDKERREDSAFVLYVPMSMEQCPLQNCDRKIWNLREVTLMTRLLKELEDHQDIETVLVNRNYQQMDAKASKDAPSGADAASHKQQEVVRFDLTDSRVHIAPLPSCSKYSKSKYDKNKVKIEPGLAPSQAPPIPSSSSDAAVSRSTMPLSFASSQSSARVPQCTPSSEHFSRRRRSPPIDRVVERTVVDVPPQPKTWTAGISSGTVKQMRQNNKGEWYGFIYRDDEMRGSKGLYAGEKAFNVAMSPEVLDKLLTNRQQVSFRVRSCNRGGNKTALEAVDVHLLDPPPGMPASGGAPDTEAGNGNASAVAEASSSEAEADNAPAQPQRQALSLRVLIGPDGSLVGTVDLVMEGVTDARIRDILSDGFLKLTHTLPISSLPCIEKLQSLTWIEAACHHRNAKANGLLEAAAGWASNDLVALSYLHRDLLVLPKAGITWQKVRAARDDGGATKDREEGLFMLAVLGS